MTLQVRVMRVTRAMGQCLSQPEQVVGSNRCKPVVGLNPSKGR